MSAGVVFGAWKLQDSPRLGSNPLLASAKKKKELLTIV